MTALFEALRVKDGKIPFLDRHLRRLAEGSAAIGLKPPPSDTGAQIAARIGPMRDGALRADWNGETLTIIERDLPKSVPLTLAVVRDPHPGYAWKFAERKAFDRALGAVALAGAGEALFLAADGSVAEASRFSFAWIDGNAVVFPPLALGVLASIGRERVTELAPGIGLAVRDARVPPPALNGRSLFLTNAVRGVVPVASLDGVAVPADERIAALGQRFWP